MPPHFGLFMKVLREIHFMVSSDVVSSLEQQAGVGIFVCMLNGQAWLCVHDVPSLKKLKEF